MSLPSNEGNARRQLEPWPVILACLFDLDSGEISQIIDAIGLVVDWSLNEKQDYSHNSRKIAYRPRIHQAYEALDEEDRLRAAFIACKELAVRNLAEKLNDNLQRINWCINETRLAPGTASVQELFFPQYTQHDAYVQIRNIIRSTKQSLIVIDPYIDSTVLTILGDIQEPIKVKLLLNKQPADFALEISRFQQQHKKMRIETRCSREFHDRFIVIDDKTFWHIGCSIKDAGDRAFMLSAIEDHQNVESLLETLHNTWENAKPLP